MVLQQINQYFTDELLVYLFLLKQKMPSQSSDSDISRTFWDIVKVLLEDDFEHVLTRCRRI